MKVGDLVTMRLPEGWAGGHLSKNKGLVIGGPRDGCAGDTKVNAYEVMWFDDLNKRLWHGEPNLEMLDESR